MTGCPSPPLSFVAWNSPPFVALFDVLGLTFLLVGITRNGPAVELLRDLLTQEHRRPGALVT
jgi:hypothetical protein